MKKFVRICLLLICSAPALFSQTSYFQGNPVWKLYQDCYATDVVHHRSMYNYYVNGDTLIGSRSYYKVFKKGHDWDYDSLTTGVHTWNHYFYNDSTNAVAYVRDSLKKVFIRKLSDTTELLLYDFNLAIGDTLPVTAVNSDTGRVVTGIDSIPVAGVYRKRFILSSPPYFGNYLLEGIGHGYGFLEPMYPTIECSGPTILCYSMNDTSYYPSYGSGCSLTINVGIAEHTIERIVISPNPNNGIFRINTNATDVKEVFVTDILGKRVPLNAPDAGFNSVDISGSPAGIYFVHITFRNGGRTTQKVIRN